MLKKLTIILFLVTTTFGALTINRVQSTPPLHLRISNGTLSGFIDTAANSPNRIGILAPANLSALTQNAFSSPTSTFKWEMANNAFRVGFVDANQWDVNNLGAYSVGFGENTIADGNYAMVWGQDSIASGDYSTAWGKRCKSSGENSTVWGVMNIASGNNSTAWGELNNATDDYVTVWGGWNTAVGEYSTAWGYGSTAVGKYSTVWGSGGVTASGENSTAVGNSIENSLADSFAIGYGQIDLQVSSGLVDCKASKLVVGAKTPANSSDTGTTGTITWDVNYIYICVDVNEWKRSPLDTW